MHNVVARLPGIGGARSILLVAHHDTVAVSPGAADDGTGVVVLLETARALRAGTPLRNDVVFLFTDGEEHGMLGARAFLREHPFAYRVGVVLNVDSPGTSSPLLMYETSPGNGRLVTELLAAVDRPYTSSLMYEVSRRSEILSDFQPFGEVGLPGDELRRARWPRVQPHGPRLGRQRGPGGGAADGRHDPHPGAASGTHRPVGPPSSGHRGVRRGRRVRGELLPALRVAVRRSRRRLCGRGAGRRLAPSPARRCAAWPRVSALCRSRSP